jgi:hypothetical protein
MDQQTIMSNRENPKYVSEGFMYVFDKSSRSGELKFWRCDQKNNGCPVRIHTSVDTGEIVKTMHTHNHDSDAAAVQVSLIRTSIKRRAEDTVETPSQLLNHALQGTSVAVQGQMPNKDAVRRMVQRVRDEIDASPHAPLNLRSLVIPDPYRVYEAAPGQFEQFLLADSGAMEPDDERKTPAPNRRRLNVTDRFYSLSNRPTFWAVFRQFFWHCQTRIAPNTAKLDTHNLQKIAVILVYHLL